MNFGVKSPSKLTNNTPITEGRNVPYLWLDALYLCTDLTGPTKLHLKGSSQEGNWSGLSTAWIYPQSCAHNRCSSCSSCSNLTGAYAPGKGASPVSQTTIMHLTQTNNVHGDLCISPGGESDQQPLDRSPAVCSLNFTEVFAHFPFTVVFWIQPCQICFKLSRRPGIPLPESALPSFQSWIRN